MYFWHFTHRKRNAWRDSEIRKRIKRRGRGRIGDQYPLTILSGLAKTNFDKGRKSKNETRDNDSVIVVQIISMWLHHMSFSTEYFCYALYFLHLLMIFVLMSSFSIGYSRLLFPLRFHYFVHWQSRPVTLWYFYCHTLLPIFQYPIC